MSLRPAEVDPQGGPITGNGGGPMPLAKLVASGPMWLANDTSCLVETFLLPGVTERLDLVTLDPINR
jgi:hypothetical protein